MADKEAHLFQARHNIRFLDELDSHSLSNEFPDWAITVSFYAAVHLVEAAIAGAQFIFVETVRADGRKQRNRVEGPIHSDAPPPLLATDDIKSPHRLRRRLIQWNSLYMPGCEEPYANLLDLSHSARYTTQSCSPKVGS